MSGPVSETVPTSILKNDKSFPKDHFNFAVLRQKGLEQIQNLSGKVWTDHNTHDPGITTLEVLIYALMDLGYRARLPIEDLLTQQTTGKPGDKDDNFFTPAELLTVNPLTITDYRRLLMELPGIRNVWLDVARQSVDGVDCSPQAPARQPITLNGLYKITVEMEPESIADPKQLQQAVRRRLGKYRNLCEDALEIAVLESTDITVTIDLEIEKTASPEETHAALAEELKGYFSPTVTYYTLTGLLDRKVPIGRKVTIEEAFAGRPFTPESKGFMDIQELENLRRRREIHVSDLYTVAKRVNGVLSVRELSAVRNGGGVGENWVIELNAKNVARLGSLTVQFFKEGIKQSFQVLVTEPKGKKGEALLTADSLDYPVPVGQFRPDLGAYYSVQNDFPSVYGIGNEELPESVGPVRLVQANQLKGYLFFYDQLLAGYLTQLTQLREVFSLRPDSERKADQRHILFGKSMDAVPHWQELIRFQTSQPKNRGMGTPLVFPIRRTDEFIKALQNPDQLRRQLFWKQESASRMQYSRTMNRDFAVQQLQNDLRQGRFATTYHQDKSGWFFVIVPESVYHTVLLSAQAYPTHQLARSDAEAVEVFGNHEQSIRSINNRDENAYTFELTYKPIDYVAYLQDLLEDETRYETRRSAFLDHLLARLAESFTDYSLHLYQEAERKPKQMNEIKGRFLSQYDELSRNRGKAYDYRRGFWNTENRSGLEKRLLAQIGASTLKAHSLCHFEVIQQPDTYDIDLQDDQATGILRNQDPYESDDDARQALDALSQALIQLASYQPGGNAETGQFWFRVIAPSGDTLISRFFDSPNGRDGHLRAVQRLYSPEPADGDIVPAYALQLYQGSQIPVGQSTGLYDKDVEQAIAVFVQSLKSKVDLVANAADSLPRRYLNKLAFAHKLLPLPWRWTLSSKVSEKSYASEEETLQALALEMNTALELADVLFPKQAEGHRWRLSLEEKPVLESQAIFRSEADAETDFRRNQRLLKTMGSFATVVLNESEFLLELRSSQERVIATSPRMQGQADALINQIVAGTQRTVETISVESPYSFRIDGQAGEGEAVYLQSYHYYDQLADAIKDFFKTLIQAKDFNSYKKQDNFKTSKYSFILNDQDKRLLADYLEEFDDPTDRDTFLEKMVAWFQAYDSPIRIDPLGAPAEFTYHWQSADTISLRLARGYQSPEEAEVDFYRMLHVAADEHRFTDKLTLVVDDIELAQIVYTGRPETAPDAATLIHDVSSPIQQERYTLQKVNLNDYWRFRYYLPDLSWYESTAQFTSEADAQTGYQNFVSELGQLRPTVRRNTGEVVLTRANGKIRAQLHSSTAPDFDRQKQFLAYKASQFTEPFARVQSTPHPEDPPQNWLYRVVRNDQPVAYHPQTVKFSNAVDATRELKRLRQNPFTQWLQICLGGDNVIERIYPSGNIYHYVIRKQDDRQILLVSYAKFPSREEADKAFQENYLRLLAIASAKTNYARYTPEDGFVRIDGSPSTFSPDWVVSVDEVYAYEIGKPLPQTSLIPLAMMPNSAELDSGNNSAEVDRLVNLASSYPIRHYVRENRFKFQIYDPQKNDTQWCSVAFYPSASDTMSAFRQFLTTLVNRDNYEVRPVAIPGKTVYRLFVREILLESYRRYESAEKAWQTLRQLMLESHKPGAFVLESNTTNVSFSVVAPDKYDIAGHPERMAVEETCQQKIKYLLELASGHHPGSQLVPAVLQQEGSTRWIYRFTYRVDVPDQQNPCGCQGQPDTTSPSTQLIWQSCQSFDSEAEADDALKRVLKENMLLNAENYACFPTDDGRYQVRIVDKASGRLAFHPTPQPTRVAARQAIDRTRTCLADDGLHLIEHLLLTPYSPTVQAGKPTGDCVVCWTDEPDPGDPCGRPVIRPYAPCTDPYSFWVTVVLPDWTPRFSNQSVREAFEKMLRRQAPAHVGLQVYWATPQTLCAFETVYRSWRSAFRRYVLETDRLGQTGAWPLEAYCALIEELNTLAHSTRTDKQPLDLTQPQTQTDHESPHS